MIDIPLYGRTTESGLPVTDALFLSHHYSSNPDFSQEDDLKVLSYGRKPYIPNGKSLKLSYNFRLFVFLQRRS